MSYFSMINGWLNIFSQHFGLELYRVLILEKKNAALASFLFNLWSILFW